ncbi:MAG TPA: hypothetical protein VGJ21_14080 [Terracidiphilus sp.]
MVSPGGIGPAQDFDVDTLARYKDVACAYRIAVGEKIAVTATVTIANTPLSCNLGNATSIAVPEKAVLLRNYVIDDLRTNIDKVYNEYKQVLYTGKGVEGLSADIANLGLTAASTITLVARTKTILTTLATAVAGVGLSVDKNVFGQNTYSALAAAMQAGRDQARNSIQKNELLGVDAYTLDMARADLVSYFYAGTLPGGIEEIQASAAIKSANVTGAAGTAGAVGTAARIAFISPPTAGVAGVPLAFVVQVQDSNGLLVTTASNSITLAPSPAAGVTGTLTEAAIGGVAVFNLTFGLPPRSFTLTASATGLAQGTSPQIQVAAPPTAGPAAALSFVSPQGGTINGAPNTPVTVNVRVTDSNGNTVTSSSAPITIASAPAAGVTNSGGSMTVPAVNGVATFSLSFATAGTHVLTATTTTTGITPAAGLSLAITASPAPSPALRISREGIH